MAGLFNITNIWKVFGNSNPVLFDPGAGPEPTPSLIVLTNASGTPFITADGKLLVRGTR